ncbi:hypothetical protein JHK82_046172 [Glycine max]|nr:hypothetical protein JHK86_046074 [Glycine max]KAG4941971.1 hypothetical protein JHK85_046617 [Glycine max]KAG5096318.1 hypothetical protein JHK82_046172 [Glycine max]
MAPKKNKQKAKAQSGPKLQISAENENRLRRLLLNSARPTTATAADDTLTKAQKAKKLKAVYEKLSCEGFGNHQIELSLSALREAATFESALDWLCLNLPGNELPLKFSTGISHYDQGGSVGVISNQPAVDAASITIEEEAPESPVLIRRQWKNDDTLDSRLTSQADWIRQYVEQQEEDESESWEDDIFFDGRSAKHKPCEPRSYDVIAKEYLAARLEATKAKEKRDKNRQEQAGHIIRKLKQELSALGLSDDSLALEHEHEISYTFKSERASTGPEAVDCFKEKTPCDTEGLASGKTEVAESDVESHSMVEHLVKSGSLVVHVEKDSAQGEVGDIELGGLFLEDASPSEILPPDILKVQKQEKIRRLSEKNLDKLDGIWKKGDPQKIPKAVLHQLCQKSGWEAPKFDKILGRGKIFSYTVSILRKASGRGKNRKAGGLVTLQLPDQNETVESAEDAQNKVAAYALYKLFPDIPVHLPITEPYTLLIMKWMEGESSTNLEDSEKNHRSGFVDSLLNDNSSAATASVDVTDYKCLQNIGRLQENRNSTIACHQQFSQKFHCTGETYIKERESADLRQAQHSKMRTQRYQDMLNIRATLPIAALKGDILKLMEEHDFLVVCGETGSGKTTQAVSVAERVADERCEPSPGSDGSLIGYQVRLDSARNEKTRLLFCTTGILLRKLMGDQSLSGITHIIVDEVHERSLLGDFLLIVLKNLIEKQSTNSSGKLKIILMSATVDSSLFSRYFNNCPVVTAEGRTHPVTTYFLEDIYDQIEYRLASDSPASLTDGTFPKGQGMSEINYLHDKLVASSQFGGPSSEWVIPLHSAVASSEQKRVFLRPPGNIRKNEVEKELCPRWLRLVRVGHQSHEGFQVVIATNIAETSITIDDVIYVIDCGKHKENRYNPQKKLSSMVEDWISRANATQRRGRAGRVKPGICFSLYTRHRFEKLMRPYQVPEMLRMPLVELCLQIKLLSLGYIKPFLSEALEPPKVEAMDSAISLLYEVGALEGDEELTPLGHHLAKLPVDVLIGKMMLYGAMFGCLSPILSVAAFLSYKSPFVYPKDERQNVERAKLTLLNDKLDGPGNTNDIDRQSDHLLMMTAYKRWERILTEGDEGTVWNFASRHWSHHSSERLSGLYPNVAAGEQGIVAAVLSSLKQSSSSASSGRTVWFDGRREVHIHPSSINNNSKGFQYPFLVFLEKTGQLIIDGWLKLTAPAQIAVLFKELRLALHSILKELIRKPETNEFATIAPLAATAGTPMPGKVESPQQ